MDVILPNGQTIKGIPDGTPKDVIMQKAISAGIATEQDFIQDSMSAEEIAPRQVMEPASPRARRAQELREKAQFAERTRAAQELPEIQDSGLLAGEDQASIAAIAPVLLTTTNPQEMADILQSNFPNVGIQYDEAGNIIAANNETGARAILNRPGLSGLDMLQFLGIGAAFTPAGRAATALGAGARGVLTESAIQGAQKAAGGQFDTEDVALAGALGAASKGLENVIGGGYRLSRGQIPEEQAAIIREGSEAGVPVMTTDLIEPETLAGKLARSTGERVPFAGTGTLRATQQEARQEAVEQFVNKYQEPSYSDIVSSLREKSKGVRQAAGNVLQSTGSKLDSVGEIPVNKSISQIDDALSELERPGVLTSAEAKEELQKLKEVLSQPQTFTTLKENRTFFNDVINSFGKVDRSQLPGRAKSLLTKAEDALTDDMKSFAKRNLSPKEYSSWKKANQIYAGEAEKLKKTRIKNVLDKGDTTPESVETLLFSKKPSEVKSLYDSLTKEGRDNARSALVYKAFDNASKRSGGATANTFSSELNKIAKQTDVFFKGDQKKQLEGFKRLMDATRRAQDAAVETPTGQQLLGAGAGYAAFTDLGATLGLGGTAGGLARIYESAPVRNALLKLGSVPKGSDRFLSALFEAQSAISSAAQSLRSQEEVLE